MGVGAAGASLAIAPGWLGAAGAALAALAAMIAYVDLRRFIIPDAVSVAAFAVGLAAVCLASDGSYGPAVARALLRAGVTSGVFFAFRAGYRAFRGREGMGLGDVKLAGVAGVWLGWSDLPIAVEIAAVCALASVMGARLFGRNFGPADKLPFGFFFAPAIWICWFWATWRGGWSAQ